jgi:hypothetical protein
MCAVISHAVFQRHDKSGSRDAIELPRVAAENREQWFAHE